MTAAYQNILGNEGEVFLLEVSQRAWLESKKIGASIKNYFGVFGLLLVLLITSLIWVPLLLFGIYYIKKLVVVLSEAAESAQTDDFSELDWKTFKKLEQKLEMLFEMFNEIKDLRLLQKRRVEIASIIGSLDVILKEFKAAYHFKSDTPEIYAAWNQLDDIWDYETPEEDKRMMFEHNKSKRSNGAF